MELLLTDDEANRLIKCIKMALKNYNKTLEYGDSGRIELVAIGGEQNGKFILTYKYEETNKVFQFMDDNTKHTLARINLNNSFHKNADGTKVKGNRINIFSAEEYHAKGDGSTHYKAYPLPFENIPNSSNFIEVFYELLNYTSTVRKDTDIVISIQEKMV